MHLKLIIPTLLFLLGRTRAKLPLNHEYNIKRNLFDDYDKTTRPVQNISEGMQLNFSLSITQLLDLNVKEQKVTIAVWLYYYWRDFNLRWNSEDHGGVTEIIINPNDVWVPDFYLYNSVSENFDQRFTTPAKLFSDGLIRWCAPSNLEASCESNVYYFPFDVQNCTFNFGTWTTTKNQLDVHPIEKFVTNSTYQKSKGRSTNQKIWIFAGTFPKISGLKKRGGG